MVEQLAQRGAPSVSHLVEYDRKIEFATQRVTSAILNAQPGAVGFGELPDALARARPPVPTIYAQAEASEEM